MKTIAYLSLFRGGNSGINLCANIFGIMYRRLANTSGCCMNEDGLSFLEPGSNFKTIHDSTVDAEQTRSSLKAHTVGNFDGSSLFGSAVGLEASRLGDAAHEGYSVSGLYTSNPSPNTCDDTYRIQN